MQTTQTFFERLLREASAQAQPQRLLLIFAQGELPDGATEAQRACFEAGRGGALSPVVCVDKAPCDLSTFEALVAESRHACPPWHAVFIAALDGKDGLEPASPRIDAALQAMVDDIRAGRFAGYLTLDPRGEPLQFA